MYSTRKIMLIGSFILFNLFLVSGGNIRVKKTAKAPFSLMNIPGNLPVEDLQEGLSVLTTEELKTLSKYIDDQSKGRIVSCHNKREADHNKNDKNMLGAMENYWKRHVQTINSNKKRSIDDLYDEMARDNAEPRVENEYNDEFSEMEALGCTCRNIPNKDWNIKNMRTKRENQYASNLEKGYSIEEYVRDLEDSFPRDQDEKEQYEGETILKDHLRIKRL